MGERSITMKIICVVGTGYVGLVGAAIFADWGNTVVGVDIDEKKVKMIERGEMPIYEPGLDGIVIQNMKNGRLRFTTSLKEGMKGADILFTCVGTPQGDDGRANLNYVWQVAEEVGKNIDHYMVIVTKSTVPVGTNERVEEIIKELAPNVEFDVASNPEFLAEGTAIKDMYSTDRTVIGSNSKKALKILRDLYSHVDAPIVECDLRTAEMIKYASNAVLATKISFINEIGQLCERAGADVSVVAEGMGYDKRIGKHFLNVSIGYGGSCFPKDVAALYRTSTDEAYDFKLLRGVMEVNERQRYYFIRKIKRYLGNELSGKTIACLGLAFKARTDDIRESAAIKVIQELRGLGADVKVFDPQAMSTAKKELGEKNIYYAKDEYDAVSGCDAVCLLTEWPQFGELDYKKVKEKLKKAVIFDGRNLLDPTEIEGMGYTYFAIGKVTNGLLEICEDDKEAYLSDAILRRRNGRG